MGPITNLIPTKRTVSLGGNSYAISQARLIDLAEIQAWLDVQWGDPAADARKAMFDPSLTEEQRRAVAARAWEAATQRRPTEGEESGDRLLSTAEGMAVVIYLAIRRELPSFTVASAVEALSRATIEELVDLRRAFYGGDAIQEIESMLWGQPPRKAGGPRQTWGQAIDQVAVSHGWTYEYIYTLTIQEFVNARTGGAPRPAGRPVADGDANAVREQYRRFHGHYPEESSGQEVVPH